MFLSLVVPLAMGIITRLALMPRQQGQQRQPMTIDAPWWALVGGWALSVLIALLGLSGPTGGDFPIAFALIFGAGAMGILIPEIFRGLGTATASGLSKPKNWLWLGIGGAILYGLFVDPKVLEGVVLLGIMFLAYKIILGMVKPPKKGGGK